MRHHRRLAVFALLTAFSAAACDSDRTVLPEGKSLLAPTSASTEAPPDFQVPLGPVINDAPLEDAPSYLFLFTHTEDPFNHELSEERYWRVGGMLEEIAAQYPDLALTWTIEFQGSDAEAVYERNPETGLVDYLLSLRAAGLVEFGYHAMHDPTYENRPQNDLPATPTYEQVYDALWTWITCRKNLLQGGCIDEHGGGAEAVIEVFGQVQIVTGLGIGEGTQLERSAGSQAVRDLLPERMLGFGFPDHGSTTRDSTYIAARDGLLALLTPTHETSSSTFWMDNVVRINDSASLEGVNGGPLRDGPELVAAAMDAVDGTRSFVINVGVADKYHYTVESTSPTKYGYVHPEAPELPGELLQTPQQRERSYALTEQSLKYLAGRLTAEPGTFRFVSADEVVGLFTSGDYWNVDDDELEQIALWLLNEWGERPPNWAYDGEDFYSLADAFALLANSLSGGEGDSPVSRVYGPWSATEPSTGATAVRSSDLARLLEEGVIRDGRIMETYAVGGQTLTATQVLFALSYQFVLNRSGAAAEAFDVPATATAPESSDYLEALGCDNCLDTAWSLKPARFQDRD